MNAGSDWLSSTADEFPKQHTRAASFLLVRATASPPLPSTAPIRLDCRETRVRKRFASLIAPSGTTSLARPLFISYFSTCLSLYPPRVRAGGNRKNHRGSSGFCPPPSLEASRLFSAWGAPFSVCAKRYRNLEACPFGRASETLLGRLHTMLRRVKEVRSRNRRTSL
jgi:hypothetical protein